MSGPRRSGRDQGQPDRRPIAPEEALQILFSAVGYCQRAGLKVQAGNAANGKLVIAVTGAHVAGQGDGLAFVVGESAPGDVTAPAPEGQGAAQ
jgi:hypothetical protein